MKKYLVMSSFLLKFIRNAKCLYAKYIKYPGKKWFGDSPWRWHLCLSWLIMRYIHNILNIVLTCFKGNMDSGLHEVIPQRSCCYSDHIKIVLLNCLPYFGCIVNHKEYDTYTNFVKYECASCKKRNVTLPLLFCF